MPLWTMMLNISSCAYWYLYILLDEICLHIFWPLSNWIVWFCTIYFCTFYFLHIYFWTFFVYQSFDRYVIFKDVLPIYSLPFLPLKRVFHRLNFFSFLYLSIFPFIDCTFSVLSNNSSPWILKIFLYGFF